MVTAKYVLILLRADNKGEGGTLALMALASRSLMRRGGAVIFLGIISGALFYGDAIITPALSVLSAIEGLKIVTPAFDPYVVPLTSRRFDCTICSAIPRYRECRGILRSRSRWFGSWQSPSQEFGTSAQNPTVFSHSIRGTELAFLLHHGLIGFYTLGAVFLVVTGAEALYADLGHFGRGPIRFAWLVVVLPALTLNYLGQGALVLASPKVGRESVLPALSRVGAVADGVAGDVATVIASQAVITGAYSLTRQAIQLGLAAAAGNPAHVGGAVRPDLHAAGQYVAFDRRVAAGGPVPLV